MAIPIEPTGNISGGRLVNVAPCFGMAVTAVTWNGAVRVERPAIAERRE